MGNVSRIAALAGMTTAGLLAACAPQGGYATREALVAPVSCSNQTFEIYFDEGHSRLTPVARQAIALSADRLAGCQIESVTVTGLSSATGSAQANQNLSEQRAAAVQMALAEEGWPVAKIEVAAVGADGAQTGRVNEPLRRRTEVVVVAHSPRR